MATQFRSEQDLQRYFLPKLRNVVDYMVQKILAENKAVVEQIVYAAYQPTVYNRTGEFKEAWETDSQEMTAQSKVRGEFKYAPDKLTPGTNDMSDPHYGQHYTGANGENSKGGPEMTEGLAEVIYQGLAGPAFGHGTTTGAWHARRNAWQALLKVVSKTAIRQWFREGCAREGIPIQGHTLGIGTFD